MSFKRRAMFCIRLILSGSLIFSVAQAIDSNEPLNLEARANSLEKTSRLSQLKKALNDMGLSLSAGVTYSQKVIERSEGENSGYSLYNYSLGYAMTELWRAKVGATVYNNINADNHEQLYLSSVSLGFGRAAYDFNGFKFIPNLSFRLPVGKYDRLRDSLYLGTSLSTTVMLPQEWLARGVSVYTSARVGKNFHQYETRLGGNPNTEWSGGVSLGASWQAQSWLSVSASGGYGLAYTYTPKGHEFYSFNQSITASYEVFRLTLGHSFENSLLAPNGVDYEVRVFDEDYSRFYVSLGATL